MSRPPGQIKRKNKESKGRCGQEKVQKSSAEGGADWQAQKTKAKEKRACEASSRDRDAHISRSRAQKKAKVQAMTRASTDQIRSTTSSAEENCKAVGGGVTVESQNATVCYWTWSQAAAEA